MQLSGSTFSCRTVNFLTNEILWTSLSSQSKSEKSYWQCSRHFKKKFTYLYLRQVYGVFSPHLLFFFFILDLSWFVLPKTYVAQGTNQCPQWL